MPGEQSAELDRCRAQEGERSAATTALFPTNRLGPFQSFQLGSTQGRSGIRGNGRICILGHRYLSQTDLQFLKTFKQSSVREQIFSDFGNINLVPIPKLDVPKA